MLPTGFGKSQFCAYLDTVHLPEQTDNTDCTSNMLTQNFVIHTDTTHMHDSDTFHGYVTPNNRNIFRVSLSKPHIDHDNSPVRNNDMSVSMYIYLAFVIPWSPRS